MNLQKKKQLCILFFLPTTQHSMTLGFYFIVIEMSQTNEFTNHEITICK